MGKRKSSKPPPKARAEPLATTFKCVFCHREKAVSVKMDKQEMYGHLTCKECGQRYSTPINNVYCDWKDACEEIRLKQPAKTRPTRPPNPIAHGAAGGAAFNAGGRAFEKDADADVDGDGESDAEGGGGGRKVGYLDDEDEEGEDEDEAEREAGERAREGKKRRVVADSEDEDED